MLRAGSVQYLSTDSLTALNLLSGERNNRRPNPEWVTPAVAPGPQRYKVLVARWSNGSVMVRSGQVRELDAAVAAQIGQDCPCGLYAVAGPELAELDASVPAGMRVDWRPDAAPAKVNG